MKKSKEKVYEKRSFKATVYVILKFLVILAMVRQFIQGNFSGVFLCLLTLVLFLIPSFLDRKFNIELPDTMEIIIYLFIFSAEILGEINEFYIHFKHWDTMLHTMNGFLMAAIGFALIDLLNKSDRTHIKLSPVYVSLVAFCFSMTVGVLWEFFEYGMDTTFKMDMQKDYIIQEITSVKFDENNGNNYVTIPIETLVVNGEDWMSKYGGYVDIGLHDTMKDLFVNFLGAVIFSTIGWFYLKTDNMKILDYVPRRKRVNE